VADWQKFYDHLEVLASKAHKELFEEKYPNCVEYTPKSMEEIKKTFRDTCKKMEEYITSDLLDRHKLIAAFVRAILKHPLFITNEEAAKKVQAEGMLYEDNYYRVIFPNEYFVMFMIESILTDFGKSVKEKLWGEESYSFTFPSYVYNIAESVDDENLHRSGVSFRFEMIKLLNVYKNDNSTCCTLLLAQVILMSEIANDSGRLDYSSKYYSPIGE